MTMKQCQIMKVVLWTLLLLSMSFAEGGASPTAGTTGMSCVANNLGIPSIDGDGYYEICSDAEFKTFVSMVNGAACNTEGVQCGRRSGPFVEGETLFKFVNYKAKLVGDIVLNANLLNADGSLNDQGGTRPIYSLTPIGNDTVYFNGIFDGQGHTISGLYINSSEDYVGLFAYNTGTVTNLGVVDSYVKGGSTVGGVVAYNFSDDVHNFDNKQEPIPNAKTVSNVYYSGVVKGDVLGGETGGVVGKSSGIVSNCYNRGSVKGNFNVGGVVGQNDEGSVSYCYNTGAVSGSGDNIGGVVGLSNKFVSYCYNTGSVEGVYKVGGVIGEGWSGSVSGEIHEYLYNTGSVKGDYNVGGLFGYNDGSFIYSYNTGSVEGNTNVGGLIGEGYGFSHNSYACYFNTDFFAGAAVGRGDNLPSYFGGKSTEELAKSAAEVFKKDYVVPNGWGDGSLDETSYRLPYLKVFGEASQPQIAKLTVTFTFVNIKGVKEQEMINLVPGKKIPAAKVPTKTGIEVTGWYTNLDDETTKWDFENGVVTENIELISKGVYQIATAEDLKDFASLVNGGKIDASAVLTADIVLNENVLTNADGESNVGADGNYTGTTPATVWTPIGGFSYQYRGTFDGQGHTISGLYVVGTGSDYLGLFGYIVKGAKVQNVGVVDSYFNNAGSAGGIVGCSYYGIVSNVYSASFVCGRNNAGGIVGNNEYGSIYNAYNRGYIIGTNSDNNNVGGIAGSNYNGTISNVYSTGTVDRGDNSIGGICGYNNNKISNAYFNTDNFSGKATSTTGGTLNNVKGLPIAQFANIKIADVSGFPLLDGETESSWVAGSIDGSELKFPYLKVFGENSQFKVEIKKVTIVDIADGTKIGDVFVLPGSKLSLTSVQVDGHGILKLYKNVAGEDVEWDFETDVVSDNIELKAKCLKVVDSFYQISDAQELMLFALIANNGQNSASAKLTNDITINENVLKADGDLNGDGTNFTPWTPIGTKESAFTGTFDGDGHTIGGLYFNNEKVDYVGLFGHIGEGAKVQNVGVLDSYFKGRSYLGSVVGLNEGSVNSVYNAGTVLGFDMYVGGIVGKNNGIVTNVYNAGVMDKDEDSFVDGGVVGLNNGTVKNAYFTNIVKSVTNGIGGVVGRNDEGGSISNAYFNTAYFSGNAEYENNHGSVNNVKGLSLTQFANLKIADANGFPLLDGETESPWVSGGVENSVCKLPYLKIFGEKSQFKVDVKTVTILDIADETKLGDVFVLPDSRLTLEGVQIVEDKEIINLYKDDGNTLWDFEALTVTDDITLKAEYIGLVNGVYQIATATDLKTFAARVNGGKTDASAVLIADICLNACGEGESVLKADGALNGDGKNFTQWTPIGKYSEEQYAGTFDGQNHVITGMYISSGNKGIGLFGYTKNATIKNVSIEDSYVKGGEYVGGIVGYAGGTTPISNCRNSASVNGSKYVGGIAGYNYGNSTIENSSNVGSVTGDDYVGGVAGSNSGGSTISSSTNDGAVVGVSYVGGIAGENTNGTHIENCVNRGSVTGTGNDDTKTVLYVGGIVGYDTFEAAIKNCENDGAVNSSGNYVGGVAGVLHSASVDNSLNTVPVKGSGDYVGGVAGCIEYGAKVGSSYNTGAVSGASNVGGVAGYIRYSVTVGSSYNTGAVSGASNVGGVAGYIKYNSTVGNSYNTGAVSGTSYVGGVIGGSEYGTVSSTYNTGTVGGTSYVGAVIGGSEYVTVSNGYYNSDICVFKGVGGETESTDGDGVSGKTSAELLAGKSLGFDAEVWGVGGVGKNVKQDTLFYPYLKVFGPNAYVLGDINKYTVTLKVNDSKMGSVKGADEYEYGTEVEISAIANKGYRFKDWQDAVKGAKRTIKVTADTTLTANFEVIPSSSSAKSSSSSAKSSSSVEKSSASTAKSSSSSAKAKSSSSKGKDAIVASVQVSTFSVAVSGNMVSIAGARPNITLNVFDMQGNKVKSLTVESENFAFSLPNAGVYIVKNGYTAKRVNVR